MKSQPIFALLVNDLAKDAEKRGFNRQFVKTFQASPRHEWSISPFMLHHRRQLRRCAPHFRCFINRNGKFFGILDVSVQTARSMLGWDTKRMIGYMIQNGRTDLISKEVAA